MQAQPSGEFYAVHRGRKEFIADPSRSPPHPLNPSLPDPFIDLSSPGYQLALNGSGHTRALPASSELDLKKELVSKLAHANPSEKAAASSFRPVFPPVRPTMDMIWTCRGCATLRNPPCRLGCTATSLGGDEAEQPYEEQQGQHGAPLLLLRNLSRRHPTISTMPAPPPTTPAPPPTMIPSAGAADEKRALRTPDR